MKNYALWFFGLFILLFTPVSAKAQGRFEITPFGGYETSGSIPSTFTQITVVSPHPSTNFASMMRSLTVHSSASI